MMTTELYQADFICPERRGTRIRRVQEVEASKFLEVYLASQLQSVPSPFQDLRAIYNPEVRIFLVDRVGMVAKGPLVLDGCPDVHIGFWDRVLWGREALCRAMAEQVASDAQAPGVWTAIPRDSRPTVAFAQRVGFEIVDTRGDAVVLALLFT